MANEKELKGLKIKRGKIKAQLDRFITYLDSFNGTDLAELEERYSKVKDIWNNFEQTQLDIELLFENEEENNAESKKFEDEYFSAMTKAKVILQSTHNLQALQTEVESTQNFKNVCNIKLPPLKLPIFDGKYDQWLSFRDAFESIIHTNNQLNPIQKFHYLKGSLKDEALQTIQTLETSIQNYNTAWQLLVERYENKPMIINSHLKQLFELPSLSKGNSLSLRQLVDQIRTHTKALEALKQPISSWDTILIYLVNTKLDFYTRKEWETLISTKGREETIKLEELLQFLTHRFQTLEILQNTKLNADTVNTKKKSNKGVILANANVQSCNNCQGDHWMSNCSEYLKLSQPQRSQRIKQLKLCLNCLRPNHLSKDCKSSKCKICHKIHHTSLHAESGIALNTTVSEECSKPSQEAEKTIGAHKPSTSRSVEEKTLHNINAHCSNSSISQVILSTAEVYIHDIDGNAKKARVLLDSGSQSNLIVASVVEKLGLPSTKINYPISGIMQQRSYILNSVKIHIKSTNSDFEETQECLIVPTITEKIPQMILDTSRIKYSSSIRLADPNYHKPGKIDLLLGAALFWKILKIGEAIVKEDQPILQNTQLGWILGGEVKTTAQPKGPRVCGLVADTLNEQVERFWRTEELPITPILSEEERYCLDYFKNTVKRNEQGRFVVSLPKYEHMKLGDSKKNALQRFQSTERRFKKQPELKKAYVEFLEEYRELGHMARVSLEAEGAYYLPHHPVIRSSSITTKVRVVFDGSAKSTNGISLNEKLMIGPNLQGDIFSILVRFRSHQYVITADIAMMYRQIEVNEDDRQLQRIVWRSCENEPIEAYTLNTLTYGTSCAPFLALKCLKQLAEDDGHEYPLAKIALDQDFYMDDVLTGAFSIEETKNLQGQLSNLLMKAQFPLRKWRSNHSTILKHVEDQKENDNLLTINKHEVLKALGILWDAQNDVLQYRITLEATVKLTKRNVLSAISKIYDPLGLLGPILIVAKIFMQEIWKAQIEWDQVVPPTLNSDWSDYYNSLAHINELRIPRNVNPNNITRNIILHGFSDSSEKGFGACIYVVSSSREGVPNVQLLCSKHKVAPLKTLTLPRLELNAALLLARLMNVVELALTDRVQSRYLWCDSTIVLTWIQTPPHLLKTFVANRISVIQEITKKDEWAYVKSEENPADVLSRGCTIEQLKGHPLWWNGPKWLPYRENWPEKKILPLNEVPEQKTNIILVSTQKSQEVLYKFSSYSKLRRIIAYCRRFIKRCLKQNPTGALTRDELDEADKCIARMVQREAFDKEFEDLSRNKGVHRKSPLSPLKPFLDKDKLIRVGGRLSKADISEDQRHPIVLPAKHHITEILMKHEHTRLLHCGPEQLLYAIRLCYWPLSGRRIARKVTRTCVVCFKNRPKPLDALMADLPADRVKGNSRPFAVCGVDYAGPIQIREGKRRGRIPVAKAYIAVFVCFHTRAFHLELVSDLTTEAFIASLRRFISRRGICNSIYSDNGTNFVGASKDLEAVYDLLSSNGEEITKVLLEQKISWHFIPPRSPHFGGLWESAVRSVKKHLYTIMRNVLFTFEECYTLLCEIEAILNSRPLTPLSSDPSDLSILTPAHFLIGAPLVECPTPDYLSVPENRLSRWQHLQLLRQHFWRRWSRELLSQMQTRSKWRTETRNLQVGTMVLLVEDNLPPMRWPLGRVIKVHAGEDGIVRVATIKTAGSEFKRSVTKLCALPIEQ